MAVSVPRISSRPALVGLAVLMGVALAIGTGGVRANAANTIDLGTATSFAVLAGSTVTNTGTSVIDGDIGVSPGLAVVGFPPGKLVAGSFIYSGAAAAQPKTDLTTAFSRAERAIATPLASVELGNTAPLPGVYNGPTLELTGDLTLNGSANDVWIFQADSTLVTAGASRVILSGGANACNVFWVVGSSATLGTSSLMAGTVMARTSITATTTATINGRLLARNGAVTLDTNTITAPTGCATTSTPVSDEDGVEGSEDTEGGVPGDSDDGGDSSDGGTDSEVDAGNELAATGAKPVDVARPATVALFVALLGVVMVAGSRRGAIRRSRRAL